MISSYRLGDLVIYDLNDEETNAILTEHPDSIASDYIGIMKNYNRLKVITFVVLRHMKKHNESLPKDIENSTVIHLRLGDVIAGHTHHERQKRPLSVEHLKSIASNDTNPIYVIGKCFFAKSSSPNYEECEQLSDEYLKDTLRELNAIHFDSGNADIDLLCAVKAKLFIQGKGMYSKLIVEIRRNLGLKSIETPFVNNVIL